MKYAEVSVNSPVARRLTFSYSIPSALDVCPGQAVLVPFGEKVLQGIVMELARQPAVADTRDIIDIISPEPVISPTGIVLARWISEHYLAPLFDAVSLMLPPGFGRPAHAFIRLAGAEPDLSSLDEDRRRVAELVKGRGGIELKQLQRELGQKKAATIVSHLVRRAS